MRWSLLGLLISISPLCFGGVYHCVNEQGNSEFRDSPCKTSLEKQTFLPIQYSKTDPEQVQRDEAALASFTHQRVQTEHKEESKRLRRAKAEAKAEQKEQRRALRCVNTRDKIKLTEGQLRKGCKIKRYNRLKEQLIHLNKMEQQYCKKKP